MSRFDYSRFDNIRDSDDDETKSSKMSNDANYAIAREAQTFFREAIELSMEGKIDEFQSHLESYLSSHPQLTAQELFESFKSEGKSLLHVASVGGHVSIIDTVLRKCTSPIKLINVQDDMGFTPFINATISESTLSMKKLIQEGADINTQNNDGAAAIHFAAGDGSVERLELLVQAGADVNLVSNSGNPLHWASGKGRVEAIQFLIEKNVDVNLMSKAGTPAVMMAAACNCDLGVKYLVEAGADVGFILTGNLTLLHVCAENGLKEAVRAIVATSTGQTCLSIETEDGNLPIHLAAMVDLRDMVDLLLPHYASILPSEQRNVEFLMVDGASRMAAWNQKHGQAPSAPGGESEASATPSRVLEPCDPPKDEEAAKLSEEKKSEGNRHFLAKEFQLALAAYTSAIGANGSVAALWANRSACFMELNKPQDALLDAEVCRRLDPSWPKGCYRLATARLALGQYEDAAVAAFEGCKLDQSNKPLKDLLQKAVKLGQDEHRRKLAQAESRP